MTRTIVMAVLAGALAACSGSETHTRVLESQNMIRIDPTPGAGYTHTVEIKGLLDVGWNGENPQTRRETALASLRTECPAAQIVREDKLARGESLRGPTFTYFVRLRCQPA